MNSSRVQNFPIEFGGTFRKAKNNPKKTSKLGAGTMNSSTFSNPEMLLLDISMIGFSIFISILTSTIQAIFFLAFGAYLIDKTVLLMKRKNESHISPNKNLDRSHYHNNKNGSRNQDGSTEKITYTKSPYNLDPEIKTSHSQAPTRPSSSYTLGENTIEINGTITLGLSRLVTVILNNIFFVIWSLFKHYIALIRSLLDFTFNKMFLLLNLFLQILAVILILCFFWSALVINVLPKLWRSTFSIFRKTSLLLSTLRCHN